MGFAILILLGGTIIIRLALAIFRRVPNKIRSVISLIVAIGIAFGAWSIMKNLGNSDSDHPFFDVLVTPVLLAVGFGLIFISTNFKDDGDNWHEYFSIGDVSFGKDINIGITIQIGGAITLLTLVFLFFTAFIPIGAFILYGIIHLFFFIKVFFSRY